MPWSAPPAWLAREALALAARQGLQILNVLWEDAARLQGRRQDIDDLTTNVLSRDRGGYPSSLAERLWDRHSEPIGICRGSRVSPTSRGWRPRWCRP